jgi:hypothetical protein
MDTLLQDLRSALQALEAHPGLTLAALATFGFGLDSTSARPPTPPVRAHDRPAAAHATVPTAQPRWWSWMSEVEFRRGAEDVLQRLGCTAARRNAPTP